MKFRTAILFSCLLVVPLLAMFSHKIPKSLRDDLRRQLWGATESRGSSDGSGETPPGEASGAADASPRPVPTLRAIAARPPTAAANETVSVMPEVSLKSSLVPETAAAPLTPAVVPVPSEPTGGAESARRRLESLGAVGIQVKPTDPTPGGPAVVHVASCRLPVDASGRLHRFFQATAPTAEESISLLAERVMGWKSRVATQAGPGGPPQGGERFR